MYKGNFFLQTCFVELLMRAVHQVPLGQPQEWRTLYDVVDLTSESWKNTRLLNDVEVARFVKLTITYRQYKEELVYKVKLPTCIF